MSWLEPFPLLTGLLGVAVCAWLAAVYLAWESEGPLREAFRSKALVAWLVAGAISLITLIAARAGAPRLWEGLTSLPAGLPVAAGILLAPASATALWRRRAGLARVLGAGQVVLLLLGWGMAQWPYIVYPDLPLEAAAAPPATLRAAVITLPFGLALVLPSLWLLFKVFKSAPRSSRSS
jgi:cytochrome d ubiquinol oxidase subunit II